MDRLMNPPKGKKRYVKGARGAFAHFTKEMKPVIRSDNPDFKFVGLGSLLDERWRALGTEERTKYEELVEEDIKRYNREREE